MNFEDYYRLRQAEEEGFFEFENGVTKVEHPKFLDEYRQIDNIIIEFHNEFYVFKQFLNKFNTFILLIAMFFLVLSFGAFSFLSVSITSFDFLKYFFNIPFEKIFIINLWYISIGVIIISVLLFSFFLFLRDKGYEDSYYQNLVKTDKSNNKFNRFKSFTIRDYRTYWVECLFDLKDIEYVFKVYENYISYKDDLDQAVSIKGFLSNKFTKGIFAVFTTGAIGFLASYNANIQSKSSDLLSKNPQFFFNAIFMTFYALLFTFLTYFLFYLLKEWFFNFVDLFRNNNEVTEVRKKRLVYYIHQSRVLKVKGRYGS